MHHGTDTKRTYACKLHSIFFLNIFCHILVTALETLPDLLQAVCPDTIYILVLPFIGSGCDGLVLIVTRTALILVEPNSIPRAVRFSRIAVFASFTPIVKNLPYYLLKYMLFHLSSFCRFRIVVSPPLQYP